MPTKSKRNPSRSPTRVDMTGKKLQVQTQPDAEDAEKGMVTPMKKGKSKSVSPAKTAPISPISPTAIRFDHNVRGGGG